MTSEQMPTKQLWIGWKSIEQKFIEQKSIEQKISIKEAAELFEELNKILNEKN